jgi:hypothetical protein
MSRQSRQSMHADLAKLYKIISQGQKEDKNRNVISEVFKESQEKKQKKNIKERLGLTNAKKIKKILKKVDQFETYIDMEDYDNAYDLLGEIANDEKKIKNYRLPNKFYEKLQQFKDRGARRPVVDEEEYDEDRAIADINFGAYRGEGRRRNNVKDGSAVMKLSHLINRSMDTMNKLK